MKLPLHKFCDLVWSAMMEGRSETEKAQLEFKLALPLPGREKALPTQEQMNADMAAMAAFGASVKG